MQSENDVTLASYHAAAAKYVERTPGLGPQLSAYLDEIAARLSPGASVLELGSGPGWAAEYLEGRGLHVRRTDATPAFVDMMRAKGHDAELLDVRTADLGGPFDAVMANAVLLHLTAAEFETVLRRAKATVVRHGLLAFTIKEGDGSGWTTEKLDQPRYFTYWREPELRTVLARTGWAPILLDHIDLSSPWLFVIARPTNTGHH
jgi:predicted TPR repeat methyltransferase